ncbi:Flavonoid 3',5'-hydroxylase [Sesamum angolense]|uniref:Flavonoid 3',5'-hydroxylase n=1 Tax=Sesamum angolense TaxID=2727404 RepID=A0AAE2BWF9_9LAMI|nr:Flavonoid 3',5'-hydroxylase [Sesamum angolense]
MQRVDEIIENIINERTKISSGEVGGGGNKNGGRLDFLQMLMELSEKQDVNTEFGKTQIKAMITANINHGHCNRRDRHFINHNRVGDGRVYAQFRSDEKGPFLTPRAPSQSCNVGGYSIPKDSTIFINVWTVQMDPLTWDNPSEFMPERFLGNSWKWDFSANNFNHIPFGSGRRICAGLPLAENVEVCVGFTLHSFDWRLPKGKILDMEDRFGVVLRKRTPLVAIPSPRLSDKNLYL